MFRQMVAEDSTEKFHLVSTVKSWAGELWQGMVDVVVPARCLICAAVIDGASCLCVTCWMKLEFIEAPVCDVMGVPLPYDAGEGVVSMAGLAVAPAWRRLRAAVAYDDVSGRLVQAFKYHDRFEAGQLMAKLMRRSAAKLVAEADFIIPVPLYRWRLWGRRFNQSAFLAKKLAQDQPQRFRTNLLIRNRATSPQVGLQAVARQKNVKGAFSVPEKVRADIAGRSILLVDDVMTTGATVSNCVAALLDAGAGQVHVATFALVLEPYRAHLGVEL